MRIRHLGTVALVLLAAGCSRCGREPKGAVEVTRYIPVQVKAAVVAPDLGKLGERLVLLQSLKLANFAAQLQGLQSAEAFGDALARQAGVDLRSPESLRKAGVAPGRGFALAMLPGGEAYFVVGVEDRAAFGATLKRLAQERLGAGQEHSREVDGVRHVWFSREGSAEHQLGYLFIGELALVAAGPAGERLPGWAALPKERSLAEDPRFVATLGRLPASRDLILHLPLGAWTASGGPGLTAVASLDASGLQVHALAPWPDTQKTLAALEKKEAKDQVAQLPPDAFAVARFAGESRALGQVLPLLLGPHLQRALTGAGLDLEEAVLGNLEPGSVASLSVSPQIPLGHGMPQLDVRRTNPFRYVHLVALVQPTAPEKARPLLARIPEAAPRFGARVEAVEREGQTLFLTRYAHGEGVHFAQAKDGRVVFASPVARLERTLGSLAASDPEGPPLLRDPDLRRALLEHAATAVVDLDQLRTSVRELPSEAWGVGGFAIKASALRWLEATDDLRAVTLGVSRNEESLRAEFWLRFAKR